MFDGTERQGTVVVNSNAQTASFQAGHTELFLSVCFLSISILYAPVVSPCFCTTRSSENPAALSVEMQPRLALIMS